MARKARHADLGQSIAPALNGDGQMPISEIGPQVDELRVASPFPPIAEYAFLSDCEVNCLIAPSGRVEWMCLPRPDSPSVFAAILDRGAGSFSFGPTSVQVPAGRRYLPGTLVLETTWRTRTGWLIVRDAMCIGPWYHSQRRSGTYRRPPSDNEAIASGGENEVPIRLVTDLRVGFEGPGAHATKTLRQGERAYVAMVWPRSRHSTGKEYWAEHPAPATVEEAFERVERTADFWREWINRGEFPEHPWQSYLQRSALTLKGLTYSPTGALLAAPTTSLPETIGGERNWDYRYTWIRDGTFMLWGLYTLGFAREANDFFYFIADAAAGKKDLQIMYGIGGEHQLVEKTLDHLSGYEISQPVRVGNGAHNQKQHDVWGAALDSVYLHTKSRDYLPEVVWPILKRAVECAIENWKTPDNGIWEVRGEPQHFTSSKLMCWVAMDRGARLAELHGDLGLAKTWQSVADEIKSDICERGVDERGVFVQRYGAKALDASVLLIPLVRFLPPDDPRVRATVLAIADELTVDGMVLRYRTEETDDGMQGEEGTFTICSFWLVSALCEIGELDRARELCEKLLSYSSPLQLYAEEIDPRSGRHLGSFPQAFSHLALINAVMHVIHAETGATHKFSAAPPSPQP